MIENLKPHDLKLYKFMFHISQIYLYMLAADMLLTVTLFMAGKTIEWYVLPVSFIMAVFLLAFFYEESIDAGFVYELLAAMLLLVILTMCAGWIYDTSYDGNTYHKTAIGLLKNGWNPFRTDSMRQAAWNTLGVEETGSEIWMESYCKETWFFGAGIYALTGNIECGKVYTMLSMICAFGFTYFYCRQLKKSAWFGMVFSTAAMLNPIALVQMNTFYVDGYLQIMLYILVLALIMTADKQGTIQARISASLVACAMMICGNIKFTGLLYGGIFCIAYYLWICTADWKTGNLHVRACIKKGMLFACLAFITVFWAGSPAYFTNLIHHGTFTYPLSGENAIDIITLNSPFAEENHFKNLLVSLFSKMANITVASQRKPELKIPFTVYWEEEKELLLHTDTRIAGFGILFSGVLVIALLVIVIKLLTMEKDKRFYFLLLNIAVNAGICIGITQSWWARYAPCIYFLALTGLYLILEDRKKKYVWVAVHVTAAVFIANSLLFLSPLPRVIKDTKYIRGNMDVLKQYRMICVDISFSGVCFNLMDQGIHIRIKDLDAENNRALDLGYMGKKYMLEESVD